MRRALTALLGDEAGTMAIETAIVAPVLLLMSLGSYQVSSLIARQTELQTALAEAESVALAIDPDNSAKRTTIQQIVMASTNLTADKVIVTAAFRCNDSTSYQTAITSCATGDKVSSYVKLEVSDSYTPLWTTFGMGSAISLNQIRYIMYKQDTKV